MIDQPTSVTSNFNSKNLSCAQETCGTKKNVIPAEPSRTIGIRDTRQNALIMIRT